MLCNAIVAAASLLSLASAQDSPMRVRTVNVEAFHGTETFPRPAGAWSYEERKAHARIAARLASPDYPSSYSSSYSSAGGNGDSTSSNPGPNTALSPAVQNFRSFVNSNSQVKQLFTQMFMEVPAASPPYLAPISETRIRDFNHFCQVLDRVVTSSPPWPADSPAVITAGIPMFVLFDRIMVTPSGQQAFVRGDVNAALNKVLNAWGNYLTTSASRNVLTTASNGWFSPQALKNVEDTTNAPYGTSYEFCELYTCDASKPYYGFTSWDDFFTRGLRDNIRPLAQGDDVVAAACEAAPYKVATGVQLHDAYWVKGQPYSVSDMVGGDSSANTFVNGTIYQGLLTAASYHRWHAPVSGTIRKVQRIQGNYFSVPQFEVTNQPVGDDYTVHAMVDNQSYLSSMSTRAFILIEADNTAFGLVGFIAIGMTEVSTTQVEVQVGQHVNKGDEMGKFRFGGSSHCLLFQNGVQLEGWPALNGPANMPVKGALAQLTKETK